MEELVRSAKSSVHMLIGAAGHVPTEQLGFSAGGKSTNTLQILGHCAKFVDWIIETISIDAFSTMETKANPPDLEQGTQSLEAALSRFEAFVRGLPSERMTDEIDLPWGRYSVRTILGYFAWNNTYHTGQINYIQLVLGDDELNLAP